MNDRALIMIFVCGLEGGNLSLSDPESVASFSVCQSRSLMGGDLLVLCVSSRQGSRLIEHERGLWMLEDVVFAIFP